MWKWIIIMTIYFNTTLVHGGGYCDDSDPSRCGDNGKCINYACVCDKGYYGDYCSAGYCEANPNPCKNGGTCETIQTEFSDDVYKCNCVSGFTGYNCSDQWCDVNQNPCKNGGTCQSNVTPPDFHSCQCASGYYGGTCEDEWCDVNQNPCKNGGTCQSNVTPPDFHSCQCASGYYGETCEDQWCDMNPNPCKNGGTCKSNLTPPEFHTCQCASGYYGDICSDEWCDVNQNPCKNEGACQSNVTPPDFHSCQCASGYYGEACEDQWCDMNPNPCENGGTCQSNLTPPEFHSCQCASGYYGDICSDQWCDVNQNPCKNGGTCQSNVTPLDFHFCQCTPGYYGETCEDQWCDMNPNPCKNGGTCLSNLTPPEFHTCQCASGYYGDICSDIEPPKLINVVPQECSNNGILKITWKPSGGGVLMNHRFSAMPGTPQAVEKSMNVTPGSETIQETEIDGLTPSTPYSVKIPACPNDCIPELSDQANATTGIGLPEELVDVKVQQNSGQDQCVLSWALVDRSNVEHYIITVTEQFVYQPPTIQAQSLVSEDTRPPNSSEYLLPPKPNRNYTFMVAAKTCAGTGPVSSASGECFGSNSAPEEVKMPVVADDVPSKTRKLNVVVPEEINGPISCLFVMVQSGTIDVDSVQDFDITDLRSASAIAFNKNLYLDNEYLALAIPRENITGSIIEVTLGDETISGCDVSNSQTTTGGDYYKAQNWPLEVGVLYSIYAASSTPVNGDYTDFQASNVQSFQNGTPEASSGLLWVIAVVLGVFLLIGAITTFILLRRRKNEPNDSPNLDSSIADDPPYEEYVLSDSTKGYDNVMLHGEVENNENQEDTNPYETVDAIRSQNVSIQDKEKTKELAGLRS